MSTHCARCPLADGSPCHGESFPRLCDLIDPGHRDYRPGYRVTLVTHPAPAPSGPSLPRIEVAESIRLLALMHRCPYRSLDSSCGCSGAHCALRRGAILSHLDCLDCLRRYPDPGA